MGRRESMRNQCASCSTAKALQCAHGMSRGIPFACNNHPNLHIPLLACCRCTASSPHHVPPIPPTACLSAEGTEWVWALMETVIHLPLTRQWWELQETQPDAPTVIPMQSIDSTPYIILALYAIVSVVCIDSIRRCIVLNSNAVTLCTNNTRLRNVHTANMQ